ncbi:MAG: DUF2085 domain-containing protein [Firmicutes bacterium]|nr:DUF2085 domain-containing protein [Bacillota bacterium]
MPERSFHIGKYQFPLCARCTGVFAGYIIGISLLWFILLPVYISLALIFVMGIDWYVQYKNIKMSTNIRRLITGLMCGVGYIHLLCFALKLIVSAVEYLI